MRIENAKVARVQINFRSKPRSPGARGVAKIRLEVPYDDLDVAANLQRLDGLILQLDITDGERAPVTEEQHAASE